MGQEVGDAYAAAVMGFRCEGFGDAPVIGFDGMHGDDPCQAGLGGRRGRRRRSVRAFTGAGTDRAAPGYGTGGWGGIGSTPNRP
jgi:hypothetical protein